MKKIIPWILATAVIMLVFPWLAVTFIKGDGGMAVCFILFFAVNPIYAICSGAYAGKNIKIFWTLPIITALFFLLGTWLFFSMGEKAFILYALVYLLLGIVAELISMFVKKKNLRGYTNSSSLRQYRIIGQGQGLRYALLFFCQIGCFRNRPGAMPTLLRKLWMKFSSLL